MLKELQALDAGQLESAQIEIKLVQIVLQTGDVAALKHNWKRYLEFSVFPSYYILWEDLHRSNDVIFKRTMRINWLERSEEDPLVYNYCRQ